VARFPVSRYFLWTGLAALGLTAVCSWISFRWPFAWIPTALLLASAMFALCLSWLPAIEIHEDGIKMDRRKIAWKEVVRVDCISGTPLVVRLTLADKRNVFVVYAGHETDRSSLLRHLRKFSRQAFIEGVSYQQFWGVARRHSEPKSTPPPRYPLLLSEDEAEVERLFQLLKTVGHLDPKKAADKE